MNNQTFLLGSLLKQVSRSFYLTLRILPASSRTPISLAYLLARAADTISDTDIISAEQRSACLIELEQQLKHTQPSTLPTLISRFDEEENICAEQQLLQHLPQALACYERINEEDKSLIRDVVSTLIQGMLLDLKTFPQERSGHITALKKSSDLDHYTYLVAGCVGEFWTNVCARHENAFSQLDTSALIEKGIRLGKALQFTNILRDLPQDLRIGRCYLPLDELTQINLQPTDLLVPENGRLAKPILDKWLVCALEHYQAGFEYALTIPRHAIRLRLAVLWPILIGLNTLGLLANNPAWLSPDTRIKVSRAQIYKIIAISIPLCASNTLMTHWYKRLSNNVRSQLHLNAE